MSNQITVANESGVSLAEMMGVANTGSSSPKSSLARLTQVHQPTMGLIEVAGKNIKTEVMPIGVYKLTLDEDTAIYSENPKIRIFAIRQQWTQFDSELNAMNKTVMVTDLKGDFKDTKGGFNLGRPGYIKDWDAASDTVKNLIRSISRTMVVFGFITLDDATDEEGKRITGDYVDMPFVTDIKNKLSVKALNGFISTTARKNKLPIQFNVALGAGIHDLPNNNQYASYTFNSPDFVDVQEGDNEVLKEFLEFVEVTNTGILSKWDENNRQDIEDDEKEIVASIVDVEDF